VVYTRRMRWRSCLHHSKSLQRYDLEHLLCTDQIWGQTDLLSLLAIVCQRITSVLFLGHNSADVHQGAVYSTLAFARLAQEPQIFWVLVPKE
jgi:hypothetical protein